MIAAPRVTGSSTGTSAPRRSGSSPRISATPPAFVATTGRPAASAPAAPAAPAPPPRVRPQSGQAGSPPPGGHDAERLVPARVDEDARPSQRRRDLGPA